MRDIELYEARQTGGLLLNANEASEGFSSEVMDRIHQALDAMAWTSNFTKRGRPAACCSTPMKPAKASVLR